VRASVGRGRKAKCGPSSLASLLAASVCSRLWPVLTSGHSTRLCNSVRAAVPRDTWKSSEKVSNFHGGQGQKFCPCGGGNKGQMSARLHNQNHTRRRAVRRHTRQSRRRFSRCKGRCRCSGHTADSREQLHLYARYCECVLKLLGWNLTDCDGVYGQYTIMCSVDSVRYVDG